MDRATAHANVIAWARTALPLSATCHFESLLHVRLSGTERSVRAAATRIGGEEVAHAAEFWDAVRDRTHPFFGGGRALRIALPPAAAYPRLDGAWLTEWGGSLRWLRTELPVDRVTAALRPLGGHVLTGRGANARQLPDGGALKYLRRLKDCFDPGAIFNRGLLFQEISEG
jgi:glycolate oxidase FAD binding subunit